MEGRVERQELGFEGISILIFYFEAHYEIYHNCEFHMMHFKVSTIVSSGKGYACSADWSGLIGDFSVTVMRRPNTAGRNDRPFSFLKNTQVAWKSEWNRFVVMIDEVNEFCTLGRRSWDASIWQALSEGNRGKDLSETQKPFPLRLFSY